MDRRTLVAYLDRKKKPFNNKNSINILVTHVTQTPNLMIPDNLQDIIARFIYQLRDRWQKANRTKKAFQKSNAEEN